MKARWKQHEMALVTLIAAMVLADYWWNMHGLSAGQVETVYAAPFTAYGVPFTMFRNVWLPCVGTGAVLYFSYLLINLFLLPRVLFPQRKGQSSFKIRRVLKSLFWTLLIVLLLMAVMGTVFTLSTYYEDLWMFSYPEFRFFPGKGYHPDSLIDVPGRYLLALILLVVYIIYACLREMVTRYLEREGNRRAFRVMIANQVTGFLAVYLLLVPVGVLLKIARGGHLFVMYFGLLSSVVLVFLCLYWLFPEKAERSFFDRSILLRLLVASFICTFPLPIFWGIRVGPITFLLSWGFQLFIVIPFAWFLYQLKKDKILQMRGLEKALIRSKADLQFLRSQIHPHFLFNVLNTLYGTALGEGAANTATGIQRLGDMMRFMLHENNQDLILMNREIAYLQNYIALQRLRTQSSPAITIEENITAGGAICLHRIAPMLLIPFVENAFKHGISLQERSWIKINLQCDEREIRLEVRNSRHARRNDDPEKGSSGIGLKNVSQRLKLLYPGRHRLSTREEGKEFFVRLSIQP